VLQVWSLLRVFLAGFIYLAAGQELARVLAEEERERTNRSWYRDQASSSEGIWTAPPGFRWVCRGDGVWQLAPIVVTSADRVPPTWR